MTPVDGDREYLHRLIMARCGDVLSEADLALLVRSDISAEVMSELVDVLDLFENRLLALEQGGTAAPRVTH